MSDVAIQIEGIGKRYRIGRAQRPSNFREAIMRTLASPLRRLRNPLTPEGDDSFWALKDVSFNVKRGEVVGVIGRNGAGKSTLLKILSRITEPTEGQAIINGRVGSLLEVGTGFHPELTGRENVYLNGAILGMKRTEIDKKFDEIVAFSEIEKFLDTPVKHYSSGMYMRLAFAVAAHLNPEVLIVDEVLAVGDVAFQKKCLGKMGEVAKEGRTVIFVSHNMQAVTTLCARAIYLQQGRLTYQGPSREIVQCYLESRTDQSAEVVWDNTSAPGDGIAQLRAVRILDEQNQVEFDHDIAKPLSLEMDVAVLQPGYGINPSIHVLNADGLCLFVTGAFFNEEGPAAPVKPGLYRSTWRIPSHLLNDGKHFISAFVVKNQADITIEVPEVVSFTIHDYGATRGGYLGKIIGAIRPTFPCDVKRIGEIQ